MQMPIRNTCSYNLCLVWLLLVCYMLSETHGRSPARMIRVRCPSPEIIPNGSYRLRRNGMIMRVQCRAGFELQGPRLVDCVNGKWYGPKPVCARRGCQINIPNPEHGHIIMESDFRMILFCLDDYKLAGNRVVYCNGTNWDREIGNCRERSYDVEHECDFETDDNCGWVAEETIGTEWKRVMAANVYTSYHTGPRHDHTTLKSNGGHYMVMETVSPESEPALLMSPIYDSDLTFKTACCFRFYYFMYGSGVGDLKVYTRPVDEDMKTVLSQDKYLRFHKSGNQNNLWNEAHFNIDEMGHFQIVFVATAGKNHLSDIAIDDVKLMTGDDCKDLDKPNEDDDGSDSDEVTDEVLIDTQSCRGRCLEDNGAGFVRKYGHLYGRCNCNIECELDDTCCPDFRSVCLNVIFEQTTQIYDDSTSYIAVESTSKAAVQPMPTSTTSTRTPYFNTTATTATPTTTTRKIITTSTTSRNRNINSNNSNTTSTTLYTAPTTTTRRTTTTGKTAATTKKTTTSSTTTTTTTTTTTPTPKPTTPTTKTTKRTTATSTTIKPTTKTTFIWRTTPKTTTSTKTTITTRTPATSTTSKTITTTTTTLKPTTSQIIPIAKPKERIHSNSGKLEVISWSIDNSNKEYKSPAGKILLTVFILLLITVLVSTVYYRYKEDIRAWYLVHILGTENSSSGDVETTSIRAKFRAKTNQLSASKAVLSIKSRQALASNRGNDDTHCLLDTDNDFDNDASFSIDNPTGTIARAKGPDSSLSTNL